MLRIIRSKLLSFKRYLSQYPLISEYKRHNHNIFSRYELATKSPIILMELNNMHSSHIAYAYIGNALVEKHGGKMYAHAQAVFVNWKQRLKFKLKSILGLDEFGIYKSFGVSKFIELRPEKYQRERAHKIYVSLVSRLHNKRDIEDLCINGVWVGDLFYDSFLMAEKQPTINISSLAFRKFLLNSIELFVFWEEFFNKNNVCAVNVSHCVYNLAIPLRIAVTRDIDAYQASLTHIYYLNQDNLFAYSKEFFSFRKKFSELPHNVRDQGISLAKQRIQRRFDGEVGVDMIYSKKSAYAGPKHGRLIRESQQKKILIAAHCFFDSPHSFGKNIFPDFYEWIEFLGEISEITDFDWYIKTHPDYLPETKSIIDDFVLRYPRVTLLPSNSSHNQIIDEGIDVALTCYGTIGFEYAAKGVIVINASMVNPHIAYDFNYHARDVNHYRELLMNVGNLKLDINIQDVYEYYFMRYIYNTDNMFFENYNEIIAEIGGYYFQFTPLMYRKWLEKWTFELHERIIGAIGNFTNSGDYRMDFTHYGMSIPIQQKNA